MATATFDMNDLKRRMQGAIASLKQELGGLRTGRASSALLDHVQVEAYGSHMPLNQLATISVPEPRLLNVQVWDRSMIHPVEKAISAANLGLTPATEGQVIKLRIPELNEERRRELVKVAHKYAEAARVAVRHVRRDALDVLKKMEKDSKISEDDHKHLAVEVQKATDVDGVYTADPKRDPAAKRYDHLDHQEALDRNLKIMDATAFALARENRMPIIVFSIRQPGAIETVLRGQGHFTTVG